MGYNPSRSGVLPLFRMKELSHDMKVSFTVDDLPERVEKHENILEVFFSMLVAHASIQKNGITEDVPIEKHLPLFVIKQKHVDQ